jgi:SAM-dependent methyltransferase
MSNTAAVTEREMTPAATGTASEAARACPLCGGGRTRDAGRVLHPNPANVAGVEIDLGGVEFHLRACPDCGFTFKDPPVPEDRLIDCYRRSSGTHWGTNANARSRRFDLITDLVGRTTSGGRRVLDVGCSNGDLLKHLAGQGWEPFGVEPGEEAARLAHERGITMLGPEVGSIGGGEPRFDAVTAIDVVEHIPQPVPFFRQVASLLRPGGVFVVVTGDTGAWSWRLLGSTYWYCSIPEHVSFFSRDAMQRVGAEVGLTLAEYRRTSHARQPPLRTLIEWTKNAAYLVVRPLRGFGVPKLRRLFVERGAPGWISAPDHLFCAMRRKA